jgi:hypothetical protein
MNVVRDDPAARWLPSRHRFALARLIGYIMSRRKTSETMKVDHLLLAIDRDQSAIENYFLSIWFCVTAICYVAAALPLPAALSVIAAVPVATIAMQVPMYAGLPMKVNSALLLLVEFSGSAYFAITSSPVRYVAWLSLIVFFMNGIAWIATRWLDV